MLIQLAWLRRRLLRKRGERFAALHVLAFDFRDARERWAGVAGGDHLGEGLARALDDRLDRAVGEIAHPAHQSKLARAMSCPGAVAHALDFAGNP